MAPKTLTIFWLILHYLVYTIKTFCLYNTKRIFSMQYVRVDKMCNISEKLITSSRKNETNFLVSTRKSHYDPKKFVYFFGSFSIILFTQFKLSVCTILTMKQLETQGVVASYLTRVLDERYRSYVIHSKNSMYIFPIVL